MGLFSDNEEQRILAAVAEAEKCTSGQIRVCVDKKCSEEALDRAVKYFNRLDMHKTAQRNGVLIYMALDDRKFAIIGDSGINQTVPENFWDDVKDEMLQHFKTGNLVEGIVTGVKLAGEHLQKYFPHQNDGSNELPDDIAFMDGE